jgi:hypothetical protein
MPAYHRSMSADDKKAPAGAGVFVTRGMRVCIPPGGLVLTVKPDGTLSGSVNAVHIALNMCPRWIAIAYAHLLATQEAHTDLLAAFQSADEQAMGLALEREADAGMQAVSSSCTAMDAYYGLLRKHTPIDAATHEQWRKNRTARYIRIAEVLRRTFDMKPEGFETVRAIIKQGFGLRDKAVHPTAELANPMAYDEIGRATEWRLVSFRFDNAKAVTGQFLSVLMATSAQPARKPTRDLTDLLSSTNQLCAPILAEWEARYGTLLVSGADLPGPNRG